MSATTYTDALLMMQVRDGHTELFDGLVQSAQGPQSRAEMIDGPDMFRVQ